ALGGQQRGGKWRRINRNSKPRPQIEHRAEMILMRVRKDEPCEVFSFLDQIANVRKDQIDSGQMLLGGKRHPQIDGKPGALARVTDAVDRQVHADLADAAKRREYKFLLRPRHGQAPLPRPNTSPAVIFSTGRPGCCTSRQPASSSP